MLISDSHSKCLSGMYLPVSRKLGAALQWSADHLRILPLTNLYLKEKQQHKPYLSQ